MGGRVPGNSSSPAVQAPLPGSDAAGTQQAPARRPSRSLPGFEALTRREAPEPAQVRPQAAPPRRNAHALPPLPATQPWLTQPRADGPWMRGASTSPPSSPSSSSLPLPGEAPAPLESRRAPHHMQWPDGRRSAGTVQYTPDGPAFEVASRRQDGVLAERGQGKPAKPRDVAPRPLPVMHLMDDPTGQTFTPLLPTVLTNQDFDRAGNMKFGQTVYMRTRWERDRPVPEHLETLGTQDLSQMVCVAGSKPEDHFGGLTAVHTSALQRLFSRSLAAVASQCHDPEAVCNVAQALQAGDSVLYLRADSVPGDSGRWGAVQANFDPITARSTLAGLEPGQHWYIPAVLEGAEASAHALGIGIQKLPDGDFRISVFNPNGWNRALWPWQDSKPDGVLHAHRTVDMAHAVAATKQLLDVPLPPTDTTAEERWAEAGTGHQMMEWLSHLGPPGPKPPLGMDRDENHRPIGSSAQKAGDCGVEVQFAFMASALQPADYKLAKAACLNTLVQLADRLEPPGTAPADSDLQAARRRLQERITTSLSGHMVASKAGPAGASQQQAAPHTE